MFTIVFNLSSVLAAWESRPRSLPATINALTNIRDQRFYIDLVQVSFYA